jgi:LPXTG-motif cell wall-anchored protein
VVHAAGDPGVTISGFAFHPPSVTIHVGDTVTWTNNDAIAHTATAGDGSFDTGTLSKGQSGSHTFTKAGTFAYICSIHPNMHGTVVVQGSSPSPSTSGGGGGSGASSPSGSSTPSTTTTPTTAAASPSTSGTTLPNTGIDLGSILLAGTLLIGGGLLLRRRLRSS